MEKALTFFAREVWHGKTLGRILFTREVIKNCAHIRGHVLDLASGNGASYHKYLQADILKTDYKPGERVDMVLDLNAPFPLPDAAHETIFLFNALYTVEHPEQAIAEIYRILKSEGTFYFASPFIANEMPEPHDYWRFTAEGIEKILHRAGFQKISITRYGDRFSAATYLLHPFLFFAPVRFVIYALAIALDRCIPQKLKKQYPAPIGYFVVAQK